MWYLHIYTVNTLDKYKYYYCSDGEKPIRELLVTLLQKTGAKKHEGLLCRSLKSATASIFQLQVFKQEALAAHQENK